MVNSLTNTVLTVAVVGLVIIAAVPGDKSNPFIVFFMRALELYLFAACAFLVLKRVAFYRQKGNYDVVYLTYKSTHQNKLLLQGGLIAALYMIFVFQFGNIYSFDVVMISVLAFFYFSVININSNPSIYINENSISFDDYFVEKWNWNDLVSIEMLSDKMKLNGKTKDFELDYNLIDDIDYRKLEIEVESDVLDGEFTKGKSSDVLFDRVRSYAKAHGVLLEEINN